MFEGEGWRLWQQEVAKEVASLLHQAMRATDFGTAHRHLHEARALDRILGDGFTHAALTEEALRSGQRLEDTPLPHPTGGMAYDSDAGEATTFTYED